jgi:hypothetical protein
MVRRAISALATAGLLTIAAAGSAGGHTASGIRGVLLDTTCAGPCIACTAANPCPPPCPPCTAHVCPERPAQASIACPAQSHAICANCGTQPQPYTGPDAHVVIRRVSSGDVVARRAPSDGKFSARLAPGRYRVHGFVAEQCWKGTTEKVTVHAGAFESVSLPVHNDCVAAPQRAGTG